MEKIKMHRYFKTRSRKISKYMIKAIRKAEQEIDKEFDKQTSLIYSAGAIALFNRFKWNPEQIVEYYKAQEDVYDECSQTTKRSMVQMCEEETGICIMRDDSGRDWEDLIYLNPEFDVESLTDQQWLYMRMQQKKWVRPQIMACFMLTAKRKYKFTYTAVFKYIRHYFFKIFLFFR